MSLGFPVVTLGASTKRCITSRTRSKSWWREEQTAACMAEMYGRLTGRPGVFMAQGCYAASTGLFGAIEAALGSSPMVIITDITTYGVPPGHGSIQCGGGE